MWGESKTLFDFIFFSSCENNVEFCMVCSPRSAVGASRKVALLRVKKRALQPHQKRFMLRANPARNCQVSRTGILSGMSTDGQLGFYLLALRGFLTVNFAEAQRSHTRIQSSTKSEGSGKSSRNMNWPHIQSLLESIPDFQGLFLPGTNSAFRFLKERYSLFLRK